MLAWKGLLEGREGGVLEGLVWIEFFLNRV